MSGPRSGEGGKLNFPLTSSSSLRHRSGFQIAQNGDLAVESKRVDYKDILALYRLVVDDEKEHDELMQALHDIIFCGALSLEKISFENSMVTGRVFFKGREAKVFDWEQVSVEGRREDDSPIVRLAVAETNSRTILAWVCILRAYYVNELQLIRDDDPPLRVEQDGKLYYYIKTTVVSGTSDFRRFYVILDWLPRVTEINMSRTPISGYGVTALTAATGATLKSLRLASCMGLDDRALHSIVELCKSLECLDISRCPQITSHALIHLGDLPRKQIARLQLLDVTKTGRFVTYSQEGSSCSRQYYDAITTIILITSNLHLALLRALISGGFKGKFVCEGSNSSRGGDRDSKEEGLERKTIEKKKNEKERKTQLKQQEKSPLLQSSTEWLEMMQREAEEEKEEGGRNEGLEDTNNNGTTTKDGQHSTSTHSSSSSSSVGGDVGVGSQGDALFINNLVSALDFIRNNSDGDGGGETNEDTDARLFNEGGGGGGDHYDKEATTAKSFWNTLKLTPIEEDYPRSSKRMGQQEVRVIDLAQQDITDQAVTVMPCAASKHRKQFLAVDLRGCLINDEIIERLLEAIGTRVQSLDLSYTYITEAGLNALRFCQALRTLKLSHLRNISIKQRANRCLMPLLSRMNDLEVLEIDCTRISGRALSEHESLRLRRLSANKCPISVHALSMLKDLSGDYLQSLSLAGCHYLNKESIKILGSLENLRELNLSGCQGLCGNDMIEFKDVQWRFMRVLEITGIRGMSQQIADFLNSSFWRKKLIIQLLWKKKRGSSRSLESPPPPTTTKSQPVDCIRGKGSGGGMDAKDEFLNDVPSSGILEKAVSLPETGSSDNDNNNKKKKKKKKSGGNNEYSHSQRRHNSSTRKSYGSSSSKPPSTAMPTDSMSSSPSSSSATASASTLTTGTTADASHHLFQSHQKKKTEETIGDTKFGDCPYVPIPSAAYREAAGRRPRGKERKATSSNSTTQPSTISLAAALAPPHVSSSSSPSSFMPITTTMMRTNDTEDGGTSAATKGENENEYDGGGDNNDDEDHDVDEPYSTLPQRDFFLYSNDPEEQEGANSDRKATNFAQKDSIDDEGEYHDNNDSYAILRHKDFNGRRRNDGRRDQQY
eukprot:jgi/Bigna1/85609/estExt_fgenesh1_pg.C_50050